LTIDQSNIATHFEEQNLLMIVILII